MKPTAMATTALYGILGSPVRHSLSPVIQNLAFQKLGIDAVFLAFETDGNNLKEALHGLRALGARGGSITMPNKTAALPLMDRLSPEAELIGAVNVFRNDAGVLTGYNTDGVGLVMLLDDNKIAYRGEKIVVGGAGGAGRAVALQMALSGAREIAIFDVSVPAAEALANCINAHVKTCRAYACPLTQAGLVAELRVDASVYVDCTPLGMYPHTQDSILSSFKGVPAELSVVDITYAPPKTKLLQLAEENGCRGFNGLDMIYNQGAKAFEIWTGTPMPLAYVKQQSRELVEALFSSPSNEE